MAGHLIASEADAANCDPPADPQHPWPSLEAVLQRPLSLPRWVGWRLKAMVAIVVMALAGVLLMAHWLASQPRFPFSLSVTPAGEVRLDTADYPPLRPLEGRLLKSIVIEHGGAGEGAPGIEAPIPPLALFPSGRWLLDEEGLRRFVAGHVELSNALDQWSPDGVTVRLKLQGHPDEPILIAPRGWAGITPMYWVLATLSLVVASMGAMVLLSNADWRYGGFALLSMTQAGNLLLMALESNLGLFTPTWLLSLDTALRALFDLLGAAGLVHIALLNSTPARHWGFKAAAAWTCALGLWTLHGGLPAAQAWWLLQLGCAGLAMCAIALTLSEQRRLPHPLNLLMFRVLLIGSLTWALLTLAVWLTRDRPDLNLEISTWGVAGWQTFVTSMVLIAPYFSRTRQVQREFMLLAASGTVAASLDLLFIAVFSMGQLASMAISLMLSMGLYLSFRRWLLTQLPRPDSLSMEQVFQQIYRIARQIELQPESACPAMSRLMRDLFDPLDVLIAEGALNQVTLEQDGGLMLVPVPSLAPMAQTRRTVLVIKHARRGQHLFTRDDCALAQRIVEQLQRALSFDQAVEQGRSEERLRIAQDLHDDIGARLLTLMYQAPTPEIEEYIRHTIQDLKTLTRGLAAHTHCLTQAAGEWKRDISHRLSVARCELDWQVKLEREIGLNVVQWSALTRILRELVSNTISHAQARRVQVTLSLQEGTLRLTVCDDGVGTAPETWSHGLGLGGVRKRVKQLGGNVRWSVREPQGVCCEVDIPNFAGACPEDQVEQASGHASGHASH
jgi:signal transduction histidine kinase